MAPGRPARPPLPAAISMIARYEVAVMPVAAREIARWRERARAIPDPELRRLALETIAAEAANAEAAAAFATLAPRARRRQVVELLVAWQLLYDFLDTLGEQPAEDPLRNGLQLHRALTAALGADELATPFFALHPRHDDGGYLRALAGACRERFSALPAAAAVAPVAVAAAQRCAEAQSTVHAGLASGDFSAVRAWAAAQPGAEDYLWWEIAAGGVSDLAVLALLVSAAGRSATGTEAAAVADAYWPHVCVLSTLLDGVVDETADGERAGGSYLVDCAGGAVPPHRVARAARAAVGATLPLRDGGTHTAIAAGIAAFYATVPAASDARVATAMAPVLDALRPAATPLVTVLRARQLWRAAVGC